MGRVSRPPAARESPLTIHNKKSWQEKKSRSVIMQKEKKNKTAVVLFPFGPQERELPTTKGTRNTIQAKHQEQQAENQGYKHAFQTPISSNKENSIT